MLSSLHLVVAMAMPAVTSALLVLAPVGLTSAKSLDSEGSSSPCPPLGTTCPYDISRAGWFASTQSQEDSSIQRKVASAKVAAVGAIAAKYVEQKDFLRADKLIDIILNSPADASAKVAAVGAIAAKYVEQKDFLRADKLIDIILNSPADASAKVTAVGAIAAKYAEQKDFPRTDRLIDVILKVQDGTN